MTDSRRRVQQSTYFFVDVHEGLLDDTDNSSQGICGRVVKETELYRRQAFDEKTGKLVIDPKTLQTAPSSIFVLLRTSHRLLYVRELSDAPSINQFRSTAKVFIEMAHV